METNEEKIQLAKTLQLVYKDINPDMISKRVDSYFGMDSKVAFKQVVLDLYKIYGKSPDVFYEKIKELDKITIKGTTVQSSQLEEKFKEWIGVNQTNKMTIEDNHKKISRILPWLLSELEKYQIDYFLVGALPCYLRTNQKSIRYHDDIDLLLNEKDIPRIKEILENSDFVFEDNRENSQKTMSEKGMPSGPHEIMANDKNSEFHLGFFPFERGLNGEVIQKEYYKDENGKPKVFKRVPSIEKSNLSYPNETYYLPSGEPFKMCSLESIYSIKKFTETIPGREKDAIDVAMMESSGLLNKEVIQALKKLESSTQIVIEDFEPLMLKEMDDEMVLVRKIKK